MPRRRSPIQPVTHCGQCGLAVLECHCVDDMLKGMDAKRADLLRQIAELEEQERALRANKI